MTRLITSRVFPGIPHRGIETVTYLISGDIKHEDSLGNKGNILDGCCQWMTQVAASFTKKCHSQSDRMLGVQLWLNLPHKDKMVDPKYRDIRSDMVPKVRRRRLEIKIISGNYKGISEGLYKVTM